MDEKTEIRRMLKWFKEQLPPHELVGWRIHAQPVPRPLQIEGEALTASHYPNFHIEGMAKCKRCGGYFRFSPLINSTTYSEDSIPDAVETLKEQTVREAGPCWGDAPEVWDGTGPVPALDSTAAQTAIRTQSA